MWMVDHLDDLESDFSVFHRVDDMYSMPARRFVSLANRLPAYQGVMTIRAEEQADRSAPAVPGSVVSDSDMRTDPAIAGLVEFG